MTNLRQEQIREAVKRLKASQMFPTVIDQFEKSQIVHYSERSPFGGVLYWLSNQKEWSLKIKTFEEENNALVYHVTHEHTAFGECLTLLYVSQYNSEWEEDLKNINDVNEEKEFSVCAYVMNLSYPEYSEFGYVTLKNQAGGLIRVA